MENLRVYAENNIVKAREYIYNSGNTVDGTKVEQALGNGLWVPVLVSTRYLPLCRSDSDKLPAEYICQEAGTTGH